jgi:uncharacterized RDD family membrane protein YckC
MNLSSELRIRTPEGVVFSYRLAGPITRALAWAIDFLIGMVVTIAVGSLLTYLHFLSRDIATGLTLVAFFVTSIGYGILFEWLWRGQTPGKRLLRLRVIDGNGLRLQFYQLFLRNLLRPVDSLPVFYLVGGLAALLSRRAQRLGDLAADTVVVHTPRYSEPDLEQLLAGKFNSLRRSPHLAARLRQRVTPEEARLALSALLRRESYDPEARVALFAELASHFKSLVTFPAEDTEALPDEQYVRNVVDILFRSKARETTPPPATLSPPPVPVVPSGSPVATSL